MSTELAVLETGLAGDRKAIAATVGRIKSMMPIPDDAPAEAVWGLAQVSFALNLNPLVGEAYLAKFNGKYQPIIGTMGYEKKAREQSEFHYDFEVLDEAEMKIHRGDLYDPEDYGVRITLYNYKKAQTCKSLGIPYKPAVSYGFWRKKANEVTEWNPQTRKRVPTGEWKPDNIPSSWTKVMVAEKRAVRNALKRDFSMGAFEAQAQALGAGDSDEFDSKVYEVIEGEYQSEQKRTAPVADNLNGMPEEDDDGMIFSSPPEKQEPLADVESLDDIEELPFDQPESDAEEKEAIAEDPMGPFHYLMLDTAWELDDHQVAMFDTLRNADKDGKPCTPKGYGQMVGRLKQSGIGDDLRTKVLAVLFGRTITKDVRPTSAAAKTLHDWLDPEAGDANAKDLIQNEIPVAIGKYIDDVDLWDTGDE